MTNVQQQDPSAWRSRPARGVNPPVSGSTIAELVSMRMVRTSGAVAGATVPRLGFARGGREAWT
jgi:hypothetical protein